MSDTQQVIYAPATGVGRYAITIIRATGETARDIIEHICGNVPDARRASLRTLRDGDDTVLDQAVVLWLPGPASFTGEDSFELHLHGGLAVLAGVTRALAALGARPAEPGEFSRRAFLNGRIDLLEAEAVADLIAAETQGQRDLALRQLSGALGDVYRGWSAQLTRLLAQQEAMIDFPDEDIPATVEHALVAEMANLQVLLARHLEDDSRGERLRNGLIFAITGPPNAGKSTLMNALCQRDVAIVSALPGTTRDVIEARVDLGGIHVTLLDTAGLRETIDPLEAEGVRRGVERAQAADLIIHAHAPPYPRLGLTEVGAVHVATKADLGVEVPSGMVGAQALIAGGVDTLLAALRDKATALAGLREAPVLTRARHREAVVEAARHLAVACSKEEAELRGEEMRLALRALGRITGAVGVEEILDSVFGQFCIGK